MSMRPQETTPTAPAGVLQVLRAATAAQHEWLDSHVPLAKASPGRPDYVRHLQGLAIWLRHIRPALEIAGWGGEYASAVAQDLHEAGAPAPGSDCAAAASSLPDRSPAFCHGVAYVVEGSQLGGQILYKRLAAPLAPLSLAYLQGRGPETGAHWRAFLEALKNNVSAPEDMARAAEGARWAFELLIDHHRQRRNEERIPPT